LTTPNTDPSDDAGDDVEVTATTQTAAQRAILARVSRFLVNIQSKTLGPKAARAGYTSKAHAEGWKLYNKAGGADRPLEHWFGEQALTGDLEGIAGDRLRLLTQIDTFENTWFPRVRMVIRRVVPRKSRDAFAAAFFTNLAQQPLSPAVVQSVTTLLQRVEDLAKSKEPGAKQVVATLKERGLTDKAVAAVRVLLKEAEEGSPKDTPRPLVSPAELAKAQAEQEEALEDLRDWYNDWATHLRPSFNLREQIVLGLTIRSGRAASGDEAPLDEEDPATDQADAANEETADEAAPAPVKAAPVKATPTGAKPAARKTTGK
jgi:hypothetical protein